MKRNRITHQPFITRLITGLILSLSVSASGAEDSPKLHRAIEPARTSMDITITDSELTLFFSLTKDSLSYLMPPEATMESLLTLLTSLEGVVIPEKNGLCAKTGFQVHPVAEGIQGYQSFTCKAIKALTHINIGLFEALPKLKEADIWLITGQWQNKQTSNPERPYVVTQPEGTHE